MKKISCALTFIVIVCSSFNNCNAENLKFVDANGYTGYYVDMDTIKVESDWVFSVNMVIIRIDLKQMDVMNLAINYRDKTYIVRYTKTYSYDNRQGLYFDDEPTPARDYKDDSLLNDIVQILLYESE